MNMVRLLCDRAGRVGRVFLYPTLTTPYLTLPYLLFKSVETVTKNPANYDINSMIQPKHLLTTDFKVLTTLEK